MARHGDSTQPFDQTSFDTIYRQEAGRCTATLVRILGSIDLAEDALAEAVSIAAQRWPDSGIPPNPGGWLTTTARNRAIDRLRREAMRPESTMGQRISRAKAKIRDSHMAYRIPDHNRLRTRLAPVLATVYLIFTEGHNASAGSDLTRRELTSEAIRVGRLLHELMGEEPETTGLLALMVLTEARQPARTTPTGDLVRLADQDRSLWNQDLIDEGHELVRHCLATNQPGPYQIQAAIAAVHADAADSASTDWAQIVALYDHLYQMRPTDIVALNRAVAVMEHQGPEAALAALESIDLPGYHLYHAIRAEALVRANRIDEAARTLRRAVQLAENESERHHLESRLGELNDSTR